MHLPESGPVVSVTTVVEHNHYTITLSPSGADAVAAAVRRAVDGVRR